MDLNECIVHVRTQVDYDNLLEFLLEKGIISESVHNNWITQNYYKSYKEITAIAVQTTKLFDKIQFSSLTFYRTHTPWSEWTYKTIEEVLGPQKPFVKTITMEEIYNGNF